jgi:hypothetical protein
MVNGQVNLYDAIRRQVDFKQGEKEYKLRTDRSTSNQSGQSAVSPELVLLLALLEVDLSADSIVQIPTGRLQAGREGVQAPD